MTADKEEDDLSTTTPTKNNIENNNNINIKKSIKNSEFFKSLTDLSKYEQPPSSQLILYESSVLKPKEGMLSREKKCYLILTKQGYLHLLNDETSKSTDVPPIWSINLSNCNLNTILPENNNNNKRNFYIKLF